jgi:hypothetical protein
LLERPARIAQLTAAMAAQVEFAREGHVHMKHFGVLLPQKAEELLV